MAYSKSGTYNNGDYFAWKTINLSTRPVIAVRGISSIGADPVMREVDISGIGRINIGGIGTLSSATELIEAPASRTIYIKQKNRTFCP